MEVGGIGNIGNIGLTLAFLAGLLSFLSPCVLPILPGYLAYLSGTSMVAGAGGATMQINRANVFAHALSFVIGFSVVFIALGASIAFVGFALNTWMPVIQRIGGAALIVFGIATLGLIKIPFLYADRRVQTQINPRLGYAGSTLMGVFFSAGWIPCVGPILASIYLMAGSTQTVAEGATMLGVYSLGLAIPFLLTGALLGRAQDLIRRMNRHGNIVTYVTGAFLILVGLLLFTDQLTRLNAQFAGAEDFVIEMELWLLERFGG